MEMGQYSEKDEGFLDKGTMCASFQIFLKITDRISETATTTDIK